MMDRSYQPIIWVSLLGFGSGFSLLFSSQILITWLLDSGISLEQVGWVSCLMMPYLCSFLWMPLVEYVIQQSYLSQRSIITVNFLIFSILLYLCACLNPAEDLSYVLLIGLMMSFIGATQDHIIEAYRLQILCDEDYRLGVSVSLIAFRVGVMMAGGGGLIYAASAGWKSAYILAMRILLMTAVLTRLMPQLDQKNINKSLIEQLDDSIKFLRFVLQQYRFVGCLITHRLSIFWLEIMMPAFLMRWIGMGVFDIGVVYKFYGMLGLLVGGFLVNHAVKTDKFLSVLYQCLCWQAFLCILFYFVAVIKPGYLYVNLLVFLECVLQGVLGTISTIWLMNKVNDQMPAFSFSIWYGVGGIGRVLVGPFSVIMIELVGWPGFMLTGFLLSIVSLIAAKYYMQEEYAYV